MIIFNCLLLPALSLSQATDEYTLKASYLERFTRFIEWPKDTGMVDTTTPFILSVIGEHQFDDKLDETYDDLKIKNKKVVIRYISKLAEIEDTHLLFISEVKKNRLKEIISFTKNKPILTISDTKEFAKQGVLINFYFSEGMLRFEINETAVIQSGLEMSSFLLNAAKIVNPRKDK